MHREIAMEAAYYDNSNLRVPENSWKLIMQLLGLGVAYFVTSLI